ncbi:uncharacterized protein LOC133285805 [Gastrolobium bilobum]|uniref:uncharacterized protein LOC133285805 n=1 Tax=Gastrolobium bilobum TaxID=150636 RepID=UPI002AB12DC1|nr:uncharacterized protein LOC133285805 [Gastrolobium bilobum]
MGGPNHILDLELHRTVAEIFQHGTWDVRYLKQFLNDELISKVFCVPVALEDNTEDRNVPWKKIWDWKGPERIKTMMWLAFLNKLPVRSRTCKWNGGPNFCINCPNSEETLIHVLRDCSQAKRLWIDCFRRPSNDKRVIFDFIAHLIEARGKNRSILGSFPNTHQPTKWCRPEPGRLKINTDELWGILKGLELAWGTGARRVEFECDSEIALSTIQEGSNNHRNSQVVSRIHKWLAEDWDVRWVHTFRENNRCAHWFASRHFEDDNNLIVYHSPPSSLLELFLQDASVDLLSSRVV